MRRIINILLFLTSANCFSQVKLQATLDSSSIMIGDQVHLYVTIQQPNGMAINIPSFKDSLVAKVEVLESRIDTMAKSDSGLVIRHGLLLTSFDSGLYIIPGIRYPFNYNGHADTLVSNRLQLMVNTIRVDSTSSLFDIKPIMRMPISFMEALPYASGGLFGVALVVALIYLLRKLKRKEPLFIERKISEPPHIIAFRDLDKLKEQKLWQQGKVKEYFSVLTDILRLYIERRYEIPAMESTTFEIMADLKRINFNNDELFSKLSSLLQLADMVKFAKAQPLPDENENSFTAAYDIVMKTKKEVVPVEQTPATGETKNDNAL